MPGTMAARADTHPHGLAAVKNYVYRNGQWEQRGEHQDEQSTPLASFQEALLPIAHIWHASMGIICKFQKRGTLKVK